jgi:hypothetical protein
MTADGRASFNIKAFFRTGPIRWLVFGGAFLIAAITIGTTIMAGNFRERALNSRERELENTVLLLPRKSSRPEARPRLFRGNWPPSNGMRC